MRIAHIILPTASQYERKSQRIDSAAFSERHEVLVGTVDDVARSDARVAHVYASGPLPTSPFVRFPIPYVASAGMKASPWRLRSPREPAFVLSPLGDRPVPEAVEDAYFNSQLAAHSLQEKETYTIGSFARPSVRSMVEQTLSRIHRFRNDVSWLPFDSLPSPADLAGVDVWVDPAVDENDFDGWVAEGLVLGLPVVAASSAINRKRLENGRTGLLVPPRDPNEMTHAILAALFKPDVARSKTDAARETVSKFRSGQRLRVLSHLYETLIP